jgi:hypothetical protein
VTVPEGLVLLAIPAYAYLLIYVFEAGVLGAYGAPEDLVSLSVDRVAGASAVLFISLFLAIIFLDLFAIPTLAALREPYQTVGYKLLPGALIVVPAAVLYPTQWRLWMFNVIGLFCLLFVDMAAPLVLKRGVSGYANKLAQSHADLRSEPGFASFMSFWVGPLYAVPVLLSLILFIGVRQYGQLYAGARTDHYVVAVDGGWCAVIRIYDDNAVCLMLGQPLPARRFRVVDLTAPGTSLVLEKTGVLTSRGGQLSGPPPLSTNATPPTTETRSEAASDSAQSR